MRVVFFFGIKEERTLHNLCAYVWSRADKSELVSYTLLATQLFVAQLKSYFHFLHTALARVDTFADCVCNNILFVPIDNRVFFEIQFYATLPFFRPHCCAGS